MEYMKGKLSCDLLSLLPKMKATKATEVTNNER